MINTSGLKNSIPKNTQAKSNLSAARNQFSGIISMPSNFQYEKLLKTTIPNEISKIEGAIEEISSYIDRKIDEAIVKEKKDNELAKGLSNILSGLTAAFGKKQTPANMMNNPDYEYYMKTQGKNATTNSPSLFPYSDAYLEQKYGDTAAKLRKSKSLASLANLVIGGMKGVSKAVENTIDGYKVGQANSISASNPDWDYFAGGDKNKVNKYARPYKQETMERVSKDYTQSWNNRLYNTEVGKNLDASAGKLFKSNGAATNFVSNLTYRGTLMATGKIPVGAGFLGYLSGKGEATQSYWSQADIQSQIKQGKNIDNIFEKGNTYGNIKGATQGASMAFQKATGARGKVDEVLNKAWKRILADGIAGGAETVAVAKADSIINGKSFKKTFEEKGGWKSVGVNAVSSSAISALGELARWGIGKAVSRKNHASTINESMLYDTKQITNTEANITEFNFNRDVSGVVRKEHLVEIEKTIYSPSDGRFMEIAKKTGSYGMDQDVTHELFYFVDSNGKEIRHGTIAYANAIKNGTDMEIRYTPEYKKMMDYLTNSSFKMSKADAQKTISMINAETGVCSYTASQNNLVQIFGKNPEEFNRATGLTISQSSVDDAQKLIDTYIFRNHEENYGKIFKEVNGRTEIIPSAVTSYDNNLAWSEHSQAISAFSPKMIMYDESGINKYISANLGNKKINWETSKNISFGNMSEKEYTNHMIDLQKYLEDDNKGIMLTLRNKQVPIIIKVDGIWGGEAVNKHSIAITGVTEQGIIVSNWGGRAFISHKSLIDSDAIIYITSEKGK